MNNFVCSTLIKKKKLWKYSSFIVELHHSLGVHGDVIFCESFDELLNHSGFSCAACYCYPCREFTRQEMLSHFSLEKLVKIYMYFKHNFVLEKQTLVISN